MGKGADREAPSPSEAVFVGGEVKTGPAVGVHGMFTSGAQSLLGDPQIATADERFSEESGFPSPWRQRAHRSPRRKPQRLPRPAVLFWAPPGSSDPPLASPRMAHAILPGVG